MSPILGTVTVIGSLAVLLGLLTWWQRKSSPHPELSRKLLHVGMGGVTLSFPWLFDGPWPVIALACFASLLLFAIRFFSPSSNLQKVMGAVERRSLGEFFFPLAVVIVFIFSNGIPVLYCLPILVLTASDTGAALVGTRFGTRPYSTIDGIKSAEGSIAFFLITFAIIVCGLFVGSLMSPFQSILTALTLSGLLTLIEGISWHGLDNLFVPLGSLVLLQRYLELDTSNLILRLVVLLVLCMAVFLRREKTTLTGNAYLVCVLAAFSTWALTDWRWLIAPVTFYLFYARLWPAECEGRTEHDMQAVGAIVGPAMAWVLMSQHLPFQVAFFCHIYIYAGHMVVFGNNRYLQLDTSLPLANRTMKVVPICWAIFYLPCLFIVSDYTYAFIQMATGFALLLVTIWLVQLLFGKVIREFTPYQRWASQSFTVALISLAGLALMALEVLK